MPYTTVNPGDIYYDTNKDAHSPGKPILLAIHGSGGSHLHWPLALRQYETLAVIALDLPGHGRSGGAGCRSVDAYAEVITAFVQSLSLEQVVLAGHSLGGAICLHLALQQPDWLRGLVIVGSGARLKVQPDIMTGLRQDYAATVDLIGRSLFAAQADPAVIATVRSGFLDTPPEVVYGDFMACNGFDIFDQVDQIDQPTLVVSAEEDQLTPPKYGQFLSDRIAGSSSCLIQGAGHMMALEKPNALMACVTGFIRRYF